MEQRLLIVNADDFGLSEGVNSGIIAAHERGIVTSASLMVRAEAAEAAAAYGRSHPQLDVGIHLDLGEWAYADGEWRPLYEVVALDDAAAVRNEIDRQIHEFRRLVGRDPTHIDSHQHVHQGGPAHDTATALARSLGVALRHDTPEITYCGRFYGQTAEGESLPSLITVDALVELIGGLPASVTELACHPGFDDDLPTMYRTERRLEVAALCDRRTRAALDASSVRLTRFSQWTAGRVALSRSTTIIGGERP